MFAMKLAFRVRRSALDNWFLLALISYPSHRNPSSDPTVYVQYVIAQSYSSTFHPPVRFKVY